MPSENTARWAVPAETARTGTDTAAGPPADIANCPAAVDDTAVISRLDTECIPSNSPEKFRHTAGPRTRACADLLLPLRERRQQRVSGPRGLSQFPGRGVWVTSGSVEFARRWLYVNCGYVFDDVAMAYDIFSLHHVTRVADAQLLPLYSFRNGSLRAAGARLPADLGRGRRI